MAVYLITGGAGFIGSHLAQELAGQGHRVRVLDNFTTGRRENLEEVSGAVEVLEGDIRDRETVRGAMAGVDFVLHHAALVSVTASVADPATTHDVTATGTLNVLLAAHRASVERVVVASSCAVYGDAERLPASEAQVPRPLSPYAAAKLAGEAYACALSGSSGLPAVCLRYFNVYGPRQDPGGDYAAVIARFTARMLAGQPPVIYGDGSQTRDFIYVQDVVRANLLACHADGAVGRVINVATGRSVSVLALAAALNRVLGTVLEPVFAPPRPGDVLHSRAAVDLAERALGFRAQIGLEAGLGRLVRYVQEHPAPGA